MKKWFESAGILLLVIPIVLLFLNLGSFPSAWYDEGLNTVTASTLQTYRVYGTITSRGLNPFDPAVTTGPTVNLPVAWLFGLFGTGIFQARMVSALYALLAILLLFNQVKALNGRRAAIFSTLFFLLMPPIANTGFVLLGRQVLGETAAFAFILLGVGFWLKDCENSSLLWGSLAGVAFGLAGISKLQSSISVGLALAVLSTVRYLWTKPRRRLTSFLSPAIMLFMVFLWLAIQFLGYSETFKLENQQASQEAIRLLLVPGFWQRSITRSGILVLIGALLATVLSLWEVLKNRDVSSWGRRQWTFAAFGLITITSATWWSLLSIGWVRYAYFGWMAALIIISLEAWTWFLKLQDSRILSNNQVRVFVYPVAIAGLLLVTLGIHLRPILRAPVEDDAQRMAAFIQDFVGTDDVIESWDWQVDALSGHSKFNHPKQLLLLEATQQRFLDRAVFNLEYPLLGADPDFLLMGPFSSWTNIYDYSEVAEHFTEIQSFGAYSLWARDLD